MAGATAKVNDEDEAWEWTQTMISVVWVCMYVFFMFFSFLQLMFSFVILGSYYVITTNGSVNEARSWTEMTICVVSTRLPKAQVSEVSEVMFFSFLQLMFSFVFLGSYYVITNGSAIAWMDDEDEARKWTQMTIGVIWAHRYVFFFMFFSNVFFRFLDSY
jgi:hypothetical protein